MKFLSWRASFFFISPRQLVDAPSGWIVYYSGQTSMYCPLINNWNSLGPFVLFILAIVLHRFTASDYPFGIFKFFYYLLFKQTFFSRSKPFLQILNMIVFSSNHDVVDCNNDLLNKVIHKWILWQHFQWIETINSCGFNHDNNNKQRSTSDWQSVLMTT